MKKIKQLFCNHSYITYLSSEPYYVSVGDEVQNRKSKKYYTTCRKCGKEIEIIKHWTTEK